jgi:acetyltransferase-like isoleucine patch superfamily enzyme
MASKIELTHQPKSDEAIYKLDAFPVLKIGRFSYTGNISITSYDSPPPIIEIGSYCSIGDGVQLILVRNHAYDFVSSYPMFHHLTDLTNPDEAYYRGTKVECEVSKLRISIGSDVWIGRGATILSGVEIGHGAIIGAMAVVSKNVPPYAIVVGNPGKIIKYRFSEDQIFRLLKIEWWGWEHKKIVSFINQFMTSNIEAFLKSHEI